MFDFFGFLFIFKGLWIWFFYHSFLKSKKNALLNYTGYFFFLICFHLALQAFFFIIFKFLRYLFCFVHYFKIRHCYYYTATFWSWFCLLFRTFLTTCCWCFWIWFPRPPSTRSHFYPFFIHRFENFVWIL
jgi:hypothetical protein